MGSDGLRGAEELKAAGAFSIVQDEATSVVWGMPGAVAKAGLADYVLPLEQIPVELIRRARAIAIMGMPERQFLPGHRKANRRNALTAENYAFLEQYIHQETGISLGQRKSTCWNPG